MSGQARHPGVVVAAVVLCLLALRALAPLLAPARTAAPAASAPSAVASTRPAALQEPTAARLLLGGEDGLVRVDVDGRTMRPVPLPRTSDGGDEGLVRRDGTVVAVRGGVAYAATGQSDRPATGLGPASYALASAQPRRVWLVEQTGDPDRWFRVREVGLQAPAPSPPPGSPPSAGRVLARGVLPLGLRPVAGVPGGLLLRVAGPGGGLAVWDPDSGRVRPRLAADSPVVVAARDDLVAWVEGPVLHLTDLAGGRDRVVLAPDGSDGYAPAAAFSPDGRTLAAVTRGGFATRPALALVAVDGPAVRRVAGSEGALSDRCSPCLAWSPAGDWVFFNRLGPVLGIGAYRLDRSRAAVVPLEIPGSLPPSFVAV
jgi:hypothetical protein